jgi:hypothetical protein
MAHNHNKHNLLQIKELHRFLHKKTFIEKIVHQSKKGLHN